MSAWLKEVFSNLDSVVVALAKHIIEGCRPDYRAGPVVLERTGGCYAPITNAMPGRKGNDLGVHGDEMSIRQIPSTLEVSATRTRSAPPNVYRQPVQGRPSTMPLVNISGLWKVSGNTTFRRALTRFAGLWAVA